MSNGTTADRHIANNLATILAPGGREASDRWDGALQLPEPAPRVSVRWSRRAGLSEMDVLRGRRGKHAVEPARHPPRGATEDLHDARDEHQANDRRVDKDCRGHAATEDAQRAFVAERERREHAHH